MEKIGDGGGETRGINGGGGRKGRIYEVGEEGGREKKDGRKKRRERRGDADIQLKRKEGIKDAQKEKEITGKKSG